MLDTVSRTMYTEQYTQKQNGNILFFKFQHKQTCFWNRRPYKMDVTIETVQVIQPMSHKTCPKAPIH